MNAVVCTWMCLIELCYDKKRLHGLFRRTHVVLRRWRKHWVARKAGKMRWRLAGIQRKKQKTKDMGCQIKRKAFGGVRVWARPLLLRAVGCRWAGIGRRGCNAPHRRGRQCRCGALRCGQTNDRRSGWVGEKKVIPGRVPTKIGRCSPFLLHVRCKANENPVHRYKSGKESLCAEVPFGNRDRKYGKTPPRNDAPTGNRWS